MAKKTKPKKKAAPKAAPKPASDLQSRVDAIHTWAKKKKVQHVALFSIFEPVFQDRTTATRAVMKIRGERSVTENDKPWIEAAERVIAYVDGYGQ